ncbi:hypothetical protein [[Phormidium] sp. ETS-05]|uniref:hypothetical protein n=1 Tax=[Phormidium] sp. ETS-05 TaxID=222819 RepID=UPI0018EF2B24|nr:hypothetical protein [[Phormidium] sp. ETS-05]
MKFNNLVVKSAFLAASLAFASATIIASPAFAQGRPGGNPNQTTTPSSPTIGTTTTPAKAGGDSLTINLSDVTNTNTGNYPTVRITLRDRQCRHHPR